MILQDITQDPISLLDRKVKSLRVIIQDDMMELLLQVQYFKAGVLVETRGVTSYARNPSTLGSYVNSADGTRATPTQTQIDEDDLPAGVITEISYMKLIGKNDVPSSTIFGTINDIVASKITQLDSEGYFNE